jgi:hypothetical protein
MRNKLVLLALAAVACGAGEDGAAPDAAPAEVEIGSSVDGFQPLADGGPLLLYRGPQGGYHVYLGVRVRGMVPGAPGEPPRQCLQDQRGASPCVDFEVLDLDTGRVVDAYAPLRLPLTASAEVPGSYELVPPRLVVLAIGSFDELEGHRLQVTAVVDDEAGVHVEEVVQAVCAAVR